MMNKQEKKRIAEILSWLYNWSKDQEYMDSWEAEIPQKLKSKVSHEYKKAIDNRLDKLEMSNLVEDWVFHFCEELYYIEYKSVGDDWTTDDEDEISVYVWLNLLKQYSKCNLVELLHKTGLMTKEMVKLVKAAL